MEFNAITASGDVPRDPGGLDPFAGTLSDVPGSSGGAFLQDAEGNLFNPDGTLALSAAEAATAGLLPGPAVPIAEILREGPSDTITRPPLIQGTPDFQAPLGPPSPDPGILDRAGTAMGLNTRLGRLLWSLGLGAGGIGLAQLIAGGTSGGTPGGITTPQPPQTQGQQALADLFAKNPAAAAALQEAILRSLQSGVTGADVLGQELNQVLAANGVEEPVRSAIRNASLQELLAIQQGQPPRDPVMAALRQQLLSITAEGTTNPVLEREFREQKDVLQNRMIRAEGPQWAMTTPGIDAATKLQESQALQNYEDWLNTIKTLTEPYQAGVAQAVRKSTGLSMLGLPDVPATVGALRGIASPSDIAGVDTTNRAALQSQAAQDRAALLSAVGEQQARTGLGQNISDLVFRATRNAFSLD